MWWGCLPKASARKQWHMTFHTSAQRHGGAHLAQGAVIPSSHRVTILPP